MDTDSIIVGGVAPEEFDNILSDFEEGTPKVRLSLYLSSIKTLIITIPKPQHEQMHAVLGHWVHDECTLMGLGREFDPVASTTYEKRDNQGRCISAGEGDSSYKPITARPRGTDYQTLVIESGNSQTWNSLRAKARWWFESSKHDVKIVLLAKLEIPQRQITIEKWMERPRANSGIGPVTRNQSVLEAQCVRTITITRPAGIGRQNPNYFNPASYQVAGGPLTLEFPALFFRQPIPPEADVVLNVATLQQYAVKVWQSL